MASRRSSRLAGCLLILLLPRAAAQVPPEPPAPPAEPVPRAEEVVVSAPAPTDTPPDAAQVTLRVGEAALRTGPDARSLPNALTREPGVLLQKTGPGQSSPFLRGFTGPRTLLLVDGIRLNTTVFRDGPNQYLGTVDLYAIDTLEAVLGPVSALYGSDAIGGRIDARTAPPEALDAWHGRWFMRWSSAEHALEQRLEVEGGEAGRWALRVGVSDKRFGDITAGDGSGHLPGTAYDERDVDFRLDVPQDGGLLLTLAGQRVRQDDVPRTHTTVDAVPFEGTVKGTDLSRELDQSRDLVYGRAAWDGDGAPWDLAELTLSWQRQQEEQTRLRTGGRKDVEGFDVQTVGAQLRFERDSRIGRLSWGLEDFLDSVDSFRDNYQDGAFTASDVQGPVGDDARSNLLGVYVQDELRHGPYETLLGLRWTHASLQADSVDNPDVAGSDPATPGNVIQVDDSWSGLTASVRSLLHLDADTSVWAGLAQGFRAPNLADLTRDVANAGIETPTPGLDPEHYLQLELGARARRDGWQGELAVFHTWIRDMIVESPTGEVVEGLPVWSKDNVGDGNIHGFEARGERFLDEEWTLFASAAWQGGQVDQFTPAGDEVSKSPSRLLPFTTLLGATYRPAEAPWWITADTFVAAEADRLSLKDETDTQRIPPGGTPGYGILGVRGGWPAGPRTDVTVGVENLLDEDWRIHGSGVNEPGRSLVVTVAVRF